MSEIIGPEKQSCLQAESSLADEQTKTLMSGDLFAVFDRRGDFRNTDSSSQGLF
jgi:hypothetical protein